MVKGSEIGADHWLGTGTDTRHIASKTGSSWFAICRAERSVHCAVHSHAQLVAQKKKTLEKTPVSLFYRPKSQTSKWQLHLNKFTVWIVQIWHLKHDFYPNVPPLPVELIGATCSSGESVSSFEVYFHSSSCSRNCSRWVHSHKQCHHIVMETT